MSRVVKERPILFSGPMVRAILDGRKTQTRRIMKTPPDTFYDVKTIPSACPYGVVGDRLWVRESHAIYTDAIRCKKGDEVVLFRADAAAYWNMTPYALMEAEFNPLRDTADYEPKWRPSIYMPRWASRITLEITGVRVERLNDITNEDCVAEGIEPVGSEQSIGNCCGKNVTCQVGQFDGKFSTVRHLYSDLWDKINGAGSWAANPWVWVVEFKKVTE